MTTTSAYSAISETITAFNKDSDRGGPWKSESTKDLPSDFDSSKFSGANISELWEEIGTKLYELRDSDQAGKDKLQLLRRLKNDATGIKWVLEVGGDKTAKRKVDYSSQDKAVVAAAEAFRANFEEAVVLAIQEKTAQKAAPPMTRR